MSHLHHFHSEREQLETWLPAITVTLKINLFIMNSYKVDLQLLHVWIYIVPAVSHNEKHLL